MRGATLLLLLAGCALPTQVRPTPRGVVAVEASVGGPIPIPFAAVGASVGVHERLSFSGHVQAALADFPKLWGADVGGSVLVLRNDRALPAVSLNARATLFTDFRATPLGTLDLSTAASWDVAERWRPYAAVTVHFEPSNGTVDVAPGVGTEFTFARGAVQLELRWFAPNRDVRQSSVPWLAPFGRGALGLVLGGRFDAREASP